MSTGQAWKTTFSQAMRQTESAQVLRDAALNARLGDWTAALTHVTIEALKRFLVEDGIGKDQHLWRLAQTIFTLYPTGGDEKRWGDGMLVRKKDRDSKAMNRMIRKEKGYGYR